ncbi:MAG TPA: type II secretion system F family protein [Jiangellales bacterium]|nr:type II secretion system F family protein [Jiangellales bacterium]
MGAILGAAFGAGLLLAWSALPLRRRPLLEGRLVPYLPRLPEHPALSPERIVTPFPTLERLLRPYLTRGAALLERVLGGGTSVRRRLTQAGDPMTVQEFRVDQVVWGAAGFGLGAAVSIILQAGGQVRSPLVLLVFSASAGAAGVVARDQRLTREVRRREQRILAEFPAVADLLALAVAAGEGPVGALERVAKVSSGELGRELGRALADARAGATLVQALDGIGDRTSLPPLARFADGIAVAVERGTPLADVLRAQAADVREARKRHLMEVGGRKEIAMMIPVIFLVLPVTILFALYPGLIQISTIVP